MNRFIILAAAWLLLPAAACCLGWLIDVARYLPGRRGSLELALNFVQRLAGGR